MAEQALQALGEDVAWDAFGRCAEVFESRASEHQVADDEERPADVVAAYEESCDALLATIASIPNLKTAVRFAHPWFGPMDAFGWHALAGGHMSIHRVQIERIIKEAAR